MHTPGLTNAPTTKTLLITLLTTSIALSILDAKHLASIDISPHLWPYTQFWRCLVWQVAGFANSTEALFAAMLVYCCRVVERGWGGRKYSSFIISILPYTTILPPLLLAILLRPISWGYLNYLPSGPTALIFALLAQYYASIPHTFRFRLATSSSVSGVSKPAQNPPSSSPTTAGDTNTNTNPDPSSGPASYTTLLLSDKSTTYLVATQLALSQFPAMLLPAAVGWFTGLAWRADVLPGVGPSAGFGFGFGRGDRMEGGLGRGRRGSGRRFEDLRRRLEGEVVAASGSGQGQGQGQGDGQVQRRNAGGGFMERLRGAF